MSRKPRSVPESSGSGDTRERLDARVSDVYDALRNVARRAVRGRTGRRPLDPTELVHECYLKLVKSGSIADLPRAQLLALAATAIRTILVDRAREVEAIKRGGAWKRVTLEGKSLLENARVDLVGLDAALTKLGALDGRMSRVVELRFFGGLTVAEAAETLGVSPRTIESDWAMAKAWLHRELESDP